MLTHLERCCVFTQCVFPFSPPDLLVVVQGLLLAVLQLDKPCCLMVDQQGNQLVAGLGVGPAVLVQAGALHQGTLGIHYQAAQLLQVMVAKRAVNIGQQLMEQQQCTLSKEGGLGHV